jgi:replicative DNA helicase
MSVTSGPAQRGPQRAGRSAQLSKQTIVLRLVAQQLRHGGVLLHYVARSIEARKRTFHAVKKLPERGTLCSQTQTALHSRLEGRHQQAKQREAALAEWSGLFAFVIVEQRGGRQRRVEIVHESGAL